MSGLHLWETGQLERTVQKWTAENCVVHVKEGGWESHQLSLTAWPEQPLHAGCWAFSQQQEKHGMAWGVGQFGIGGRAHCVSWRQGPWMLAKVRWWRTYIIMGFLWNWNGTSDVTPSQGLYLYWQLHLPQDDLVLRSCWSLRTSLLPLGPCPCVEHLIGWSRSGDTVSGDPGQRVLAGTASLGHVSSCLWPPPDVTEVVQPEQSIYGDFCSDCWQCLADTEDASLSCGWPGWGQKVMEPGVEF